MLVKERSEYIGMSYEQASRRASELVHRYGWYRAFAHLVELKQIMDRRYERSETAA